VVGGAELEPQRGVGIAFGGEPVEVVPRGGRDVAAGGEGPGQVADGLIDIENECLGNGAELRGTAAGLAPLHEHAGGEHSKREQRGSAESEGETAAGDEPREAIGAGVGAGRDGEAALPAAEVLR
jgi:hypothetical protein